MKKFVEISFVLLFNFILFNVRSATISGYIRDKMTGEVLIGATVYDQLSKNGAVTNNYGFFSLTLKGESADLLFSFVGYDTQNMVFELHEDHFVTIEMEYDSYLEEVVITSEDGKFKSTQMSEIIIPVDQIEKKPAILGEVDLLKVIQLLPGVQSGLEGSSGLYVRGGGPDQNLMLLDGVPIYNAAHLFGFFSIFNTDAINHVNLIKGGFPARYGGRLSSVVDITMKEGNQEELKGKAAVGLLSAKIMLEGPLFNKKTTFIVSARRTYLDFFLDPLADLTNKFAPKLGFNTQNFSDGEIDLGYFFYDTNAKITHRIGDRDKLYFSGYLGKDNAFSSIVNDYPFSSDYEEYNFDLNWSNQIATIRWNHVFNHKMFSNLTFAYSRYQLNTDEYQYDLNTFETVDPVTMNTQVYDADTTEFRNRYNTNIRDFLVSLNVEFFPSPFHQLKFGIQSTIHRFNPGFRTITANFFEPFESAPADLNAIESSGYFEDELKLGSRITLNAGLHGSFFIVNQKFYHSIQPRLTARYLFNHDFALKASYATMTQYIHLLTNSGIGLPTDLWVPATEQIEPQQSRQYAIGLVKNIDRRFEFSLEAYYKEMTNLLAYREGAMITPVFEDWQGTVTQGIGESFGVELFLQKKTGNLTGWLGYTWSISERQFDEINFGNWFPYKYDRRHDLSITGNYRLSEKVDISATWVFGNGLNITMPQSRFFIQDNSRFYTFRDELAAAQEGSYYFRDVYDYGDRNSYRMASYHRLDVNINFTKAKKWGQRQWSFGVYNLYNRLNPFFVEIIGSQRNEEQLVQFSLFPILPSIRYQIQF